MSPESRTGDDARGDVAPTAAPPPGRRAGWVRWYYLLVLLAAFVWVGALVARRRAADAALAVDEPALTAPAHRGRPAVLEPLGEGSAEASREAFRRALARVSADLRRKIDVGGRPGATATDVEEAQRVLTAHPGVVRALLEIPFRPSGSRGAPTQGWLDDISVAVTWLEVARVAASARGETELALQLAVTTCTIGADLQRERNMVHFMEGVAAEETGLQGMRRVLSERPVAAADARRVAAALDALDAARRPLRTLLDAEREAIRFFVFKGGVTSSRSPGVGPSGTDVEVINACLELLDDAAPRIRDAVARMDADPRDASQRMNAVLSGMTRWPGLAACMERHARLVPVETTRRTRREAARVALAVASFRSEKGRLPERLNDLAPEYLAAIPRDPWGASALRWQASDGHGTVWSVGGNGLDAGPDAEWKADEEHQDDEVAWRVQGKP